MFSWEKIGYIRRPSGRFGQICGVLMTDDRSSGTAAADLVMTSDCQVGYSYAVSDSVARDHFWTIITAVVIISCHLLSLSGKRGKGPDTSWCPHLDLEFVMFADAYSLLPLISGPELASIYGLAE